MRFFINGIEAGSLDASAPIPVTSDPLQIGTKIPSSTAGNHFDGRIDDIRIYARALSADEIASLATQTGTVTVSAADSVAQKGTANTARFTFSRTSPTVSSLVVPFSLSGGSAFGIYQADFSLSPSPPSVTISAGQVTTQLTLTPIDRAQPTGTLTVKVNVDEANGYDVDANSTAEAQILDSPVNDWKIQQFGSIEAAQSEPAADEADPDGDSETNLAEFGLGRLPLVADNGAPVAEIEDVNGAPYLTYRFARPRPAPAGVSYHIETNSSLEQANWSGAVSLPGYPVDLGNGTEQMKFRSATPMAAKNTEFIRLRVSRP
jgi:hypothetical protein